ncbi:MAG TPA: DUF5309 family protein [Micromonosporaceae bacterium]
MAGISALGTNYNLPNYTGILHALTPFETPFFSAIGGLSGGGQTTSTEFEWQTYDLRAAAQPDILEGADAPTLTGRVRANVTNVVQIHQSAVGVAYSKAAATARLATSAGGAPNPITNELDWQVGQELSAMVRDINYSFINGVYQKPSDNTTSRKTRGMLAAISTNAMLSDETLVGDGASAWEADDEVITEASHGLVVGDRVRITITSGATGATAGYFFVVSVPSTSTFTVSTTKGGSTQAISADGVINVYKQSALTVDKINRSLQTVYDAGGLRGGMATLMGNSDQKIAISAAYANAYGKFTETSRNVGGVNVTSIESDFGPLNVMLEPMVPKGTLVIATLNECRPVYLEVPSKGHFFAEPLAKTGATDRTQLYGEVGLDYGAELHHGKITGLPY